MLSDITLGQYFPGNSPLHRLDPRTKILLAIAYIVAVFLIDTPIAFFVFTVLTIMLCIISRISLKVIFKGVKPIIFILVFTAIINVFLTGGEGEPLVAFWVI